MKRILATVMAAMLFAMGPAVAEESKKQVKLKDERVLVGDVVEKDGVVTVSTLDGALYQFAKDQVQSVTIASPDQVKMVAPAPVQVAQASGAPADAPKSDAGTGGAKNPIVELKTNKGTIVLELAEDDAPNTVGNFVSLVEKGFYDGTSFHRILSGFMAQGGDPLTKDPAQEGSWGTGGPGYSFDDEAKPDPKLKNVRGAISMANAGPNTNGSQFFILFKDAGGLDGKHTVFGKVVEGMDVVDKIEKDAGVPSDPQKPREKITIEKATVKSKRDHKYEVVKSGTR
jgi:cyclophilin family peptidyl-prolyl cis-trans isomerase